MDAKYGYIALILKLDGDPRPEYFSIWVCFRQGKFLLQQSRQLFQRAVSPPVFHPFFV